MKTKLFIARSAFILLMAFAGLFAAATFGACNKDANDEKSDDENNGNEENVTTPPHAASTMTWKFGDQVWSDAIRIPECNKTSFENSDTDTDPQCRSYTGEGDTWYYYNWPYVNANKDRLCPSPWRVPTKDDFIALDVALGGSGSDRSGVEQSWITTNYVSTWGGVYGGFAYWTSVLNAGSAAKYWSITEHSTTYAYYLLFNTSGVVYPQMRTYKYYGLQVRCVK